MREIPRWDGDTWRMPSGVPVEVIVSQLEPGEDYRMPESPGDPWLFGYTDYRNGLIQFRGMPQSVSNLLGHLISSVVLEHVASTEGIEVIEEIARRVQRRKPCLVAEVAGRLRTDFRDPSGREPFDLRYDPLVKTQRELFAYLAWNDLVVNG